MEMKEVCLIRSSFEGAIRAMKQRHLTLMDFIVQQTWIQIPKSSPACGIFTGYWYGILWSPIYMWSEVILYSVLGRKGISHPPYGWYIFSL